MLFNSLALVSTLIILIALRRLVGVIPSLIACLFRGKESINLEASVQLSRDRNLVALTMVLPFCLTIWKFGLYAPAFMQDFNENISLLGTIGIFMCFTLVRKALEYILRPKRVSRSTYHTACISSRTFFCILTFILMAVGGTASFIGTPECDIRTAMLWVSASIYLIFALRKFQILASSSSFFAAFLYLCALEIIPTGALVASAIIF